MMQIQLPGMSPEIETTKRSPQELSRILEKLMAWRLDSLVLTANRSRILSCRPLQRASRRLTLRLHESFLTADQEILETVARYALGDLDEPRRRHALATLRSHFEAHREQIPESRPSRQSSPPKLDTIGRTLDLRHLRDQLNQQFFEGRIEVSITWGRALPRQQRRHATRRTLRLGSYDEPHNLIRIHRVLDDSKVPRAVVEAVVYHEMLHADLPAIIRSGRRYSHTREFRRRERLFPSYRQSETWLEKNLPYLLSARFRRC